MKNDFDFSSVSDDDLKEIISLAEIEKYKRKKKKIEAENTIAISLSELSDIMTKISEQFLDLTDTDFIDNSYPFHKDFQELSLDVYNWSKEVSQYVESFRVDKKRII